MGGLANGSPVTRSHPGLCANTSMTPAHNSLPRISKLKPQQLSPFHRSRSKVFYDSESPLKTTKMISPQNSPKSVGSVRSLPVFRVSRIPSTEVSEEKTPPDSPDHGVGISKPSEDRDRNDAFFPNDELDVLAPDEEPFRPGSHRCSPSHKSQDSGFSDSGESASCGGSFSRRPSRVLYASNDSFSKQLFKAPGLQISKNCLAIRRSKRKGKADLFLENSLSDSEQAAVERERLQSRNSSIRSAAKLSVSCIDGLSAICKKSNDTNCYRKLTNKPLAYPSISTCNAVYSSSDEELDNEILEEKTLTPGACESPKPSDNNKNGLTQHQRSPCSTQPNLISGDMTANRLGSNAKCKSETEVSTKGKKLRRSSLSVSSEVTLAQKALRRPSAPNVTKMLSGSIPSGLPNDSALRCHLQDAVQSSSLSAVGSVLGWLQDLRMRTDNECMNTLQSKAIAKDLADLVAMASRNTKDTVRALQARAQIVSSELSRLVRKVAQGRLRKVSSSAARLLSSVRSLVTDYQLASSQAPNLPEALCQQQDAVLAACSKLVRQAQRLESSADPVGAKKSLQEGLAAFTHSFWRLVDLITAQEIRMIVDAIDEPFNTYCLKTAIGNLSSLGLDGENTCRLIAKVGGVRSLLSVCIETKYRQFRAQALRALATVCCVIDAIGELEKAGGVECITDILCDAESSEKDKSEAAGVIAQITSPWIDNNHHIQGLAESVIQLISALTDLAKTTNSDEVFLLASAALANITFLDSKACECLRQAGTTAVLIETCRDKSYTESVFIKDQVATVLANLVALSECRTSVLEAGGLVLLLCFLQVRPSLVMRDAEVAACERVQQKSAIALSRLCSDPAVAKQVMSLEGVQRLVRLCKDEKERNQSDAVLVACLAALRKIATGCGLEEFKGLNATELVEPRLLDSFLIYSSRQESYV